MIDYHTIHKSSYGLGAMEKRNPDLYGEMPTVLRYFLTYTYGNGGYKVRRLSEVPNRWGWNTRQCYCEFDVLDARRGRFRAWIKGTQYTQPPMTDRLVRMEGQT